MLSLYPPIFPVIFAPIRLPIKGLHVTIYAKTNVVKGLFVYPNDIIYLTSQNRNALLKNTFMHLAHIKTINNGSVNKLLSLSSTFTSLSCGSDGLILNIDPTSV